jgi:hypothetical protein
VVDPTPVSPGFEMFFEYARSFKSTDPTPVSPGFEMFFEYARSFSNKKAGDLFFYQKLLEGYLSY